MVTSGILVNILLQNLHLWVAFIPVTHLAHPVEVKSIFTIKIFVTRRRTNIGDNLTLDISYRLVFVFGMTEDVKMWGDWFNSLWKLAGETTFSDNQSILILDSVLPMEYDSNED